LKPSANVDDGKSDKMEGAVVLDENSAEVKEKVEEEEIKE